MANDCDGSLRLGTFNKLVSRYPFLANGLVMEQGPTPCTHHSTKSSIVALSPWDYL